MKDHIGETLLGAIVALVALGFFGFAFTQTRDGTGSGAGASYWGLFQRVDGISPGSDVRLSGVKIGVVRAVSLDQQTYDARLDLAIDPKVTLLDDTFAAVRSDGLLGGSYVSLEPAGLEPLPPGAQILRTQGSQDLLSLLTGAVSAFANTDEQADEGTNP
jgi:phospholipid/cholesterol/gamma-HCH transport system substrate-binding protein